MGFGSCILCSDCESGVYFTLRPTVMATKAVLQQLMANPDRLHSLVDEAKDLALLHGIVFRTHETPNSSEVGANMQICFHSSYVC